MGLILLLMVVLRFSEVVTQGVKGESTGQSYEDGRRWFASTLL
jgi:hypothetical protein